MTDPAPPPEGDASCKYDTFDDGDLTKVEPEAYCVRCADLVVTGAGTEKAHRVALQPLAVGSGECDVQVSDPYVSRRHATFEATDQGVRIRDQSSRNGTFIDGLRVVDVLATRSCVVTVGRTQLRLEMDPQQTRVPLSEKTRFGEAFGVSSKMRSVFAALERAAATTCTVLLEGPSGTGKELLARGVHSNSERKSGPFVVFDCGAVSPSLIESELFGHEKGAFTGAIAARPGAFEAAAGGTIFLDEIGELPLELQPKLLRVLEARSFRRVGSNRHVDCDVRVVAASNRGLADAVKRGEFRLDLFYRLAVVHVVVPPLVDRPDDVPALAELLLRQLSKDPDAVVPPELLRTMSSYGWPGNVRELRNVVERFIMLGQSDAALLFDPPPRKVARPERIIDLGEVDGMPYHVAKARVLTLFHELALRSALLRNNGSVTKAAQELGIRRTSIWRMLRRLDSSHG